MTAQTAMSARWLPGFLQRAATDSLMRNSLYLMISTVSTAGLGYFFWLIAAHNFTKQQIGVGAAVISLCSTISLVTYLGPSAMLIERLPKSEHSSEWTAIFRRTCLATAIVTGLVMAALVLPATLISHNYRVFFAGPSEILIVIASAGTTTLLNLIGFAFIAARRAGRFLSMQTLVSAAKLICVFPLAAFGTVGLVAAWVVSATIGVVVAIVWLVPTMHLGERRNYASHRSAHLPQRVRGRPRQRTRHRSPYSGPSSSYMRRLVGQHLTSVGELTPLLLPVLVVTRLGAEPNAYFYVTWMMGSAFFLVSPAVAIAVFAESVRANARLRDEVTKAMKIIAALLIPAMLVMIVCGRIILGLFGASYAAAGYTLLILLAISAIPDAVSNVATSIWRVSHRLGYAAVLNLGIMVMTLAGAWFLMPPLGITGVGVAWLIAQTAGAVASMTAYTYV